MPAFTPVLNLYLPGGGSLGIGGDDEVLDVDKLNQNFQALDTYAGSWGKATDRNHQFYGLAASKPSASSAKLGDEYQESDGDKVLWRYDGTNWVTAESGLYLIQPSSVSGTGVTKSGGRVSAVNSPEIVLDGVFSSRFKRYLVVVELDSASVGAATNLQLRSGGVSQASNYTTQVNYNSTDTDLTASKTGPSGAAQIGPGLGTSVRELTFEVAHASVASPTELFGSTSALLGGSHHLMGSFFARHSGSTVVDGFRIAPSVASNLTGTVFVYGRA